jgi:DNA-binding transcriptional ArsR family regulator
MANHTLALKALSDPTRQQIVETLSGGRMTVRELTDRLPISQSAVSQHLEVLRKAELVAFEPRGASNVYRIDPRGFGAIRAWFDRYWDEALGNYARLFEEGEEDRGS